ncbi:MAG: hypothetical protein AB8H80_10280 [Planctomycetota bacterium]
MKWIPHLTGFLLGALFVAFGMMFLLDQMPEQEPPAKGSAAEHFWTAFGPTGYMTFVKVCEVIGGVLVAIPKVRVLGILILVPIVSNIFAYHAFVTDGSQLTDPLIIGVGALTAVVLSCELPRIFGMLSSRNGRS